MEDGVHCFGWVGDEVIVMEVGDEVAEFGLDKGLEILEGGCCDDEGCVVSVGVDLGLNLVENVIDVEQEKCG